ncbi:SixA phosphatase family protein [Algoriphagus namhaensis]|uniref:SixA phosphatase family protein n=1 Tax=Algoriphagus namhaensis TaxID=915353 RepID=A0ABV8ANX3_9BACT
MKKLILVRHGKSAWDNPSLSDHDRPLAPRGIRDIPVMASRLKQRNLNPDFFLSSTALRAKDTAIKTAEVLGFDPSLITLTPELYHSSARTILRLIQSIPDEFQTALLFGHNPGFNDLIDDLGENIYNLPTSGQYGFKANISSWKDFKESNAGYLFFDFPKKKI